MSGLEVKGIHKVYGATTVVNSISFRARPGEILGVLGPNGAGKTTTIRMIMGITAPDQGELAFTHQGKTYSRVPRSIVGYLPEERGLYKEARVMDILLFLASLKDVNREVARQRATTWLAKFGLENHAQAKIEQLSKGMAQKVQFIAAVIHEPQFIVLDEPFSGLDPVSQDVFKQEVRRLAASGTTILLSSHQMGIVEELCHRLFLIHKGEQVLYGTVDEIRESYGNYRVQLSSDQEIPALFESSLVEEKKKLEGSKWMLTLKDNVLPAAFLASVPPTAPIKEMSISRLSLHDIFVKIAKGGTDHEGNMENREVGTR